VGNDIFIANGKGLSSKPNPLGPSPESNKERVERHKDLDLKNMKVQYIGGLFYGALQLVPTPDENQLAVYSQAVYNNVPYKKDSEMVFAVEEGNPVPSKVGEKSPIKYVFYIIKENRTYDQVLGDIPEGNGDPNLVLFGEDVTPNQHALARQFV